MSEFCKQCSEQLFGRDYHDLSGLSTPEDTAKKLYPVVLCEGCGPIQVNHLGECMSEDETAEHIHKLNKQKGEE